MPINNFANLVADIKRRSKRDDVSDSDVESYIQQAESYMYQNEVAPLRVRAMESRQTASCSTDSRFLELPANFLDMRALHLVLDSGNQDVRFMPPELMSVNGTSGKPKFFTVTTQIEFDRVPDSTYTIEMSLFKKVTALSSGNTTNTVLTDAPNIYLFGTLWALFMDQREFDISAQYQTLFINAIRGYNASDRKGRYGPSPRIRYEGAIP